MDAKKRVCLSLLIAIVAASIYSTAAQTVSQEISLETPTGKLFGTVALPSGNGPFPVVLIIAGSGMTDRDGHTVGFGDKNDGLKLLAEGLVGSGIASVRYDKRSVGQSVPARLPTNTYDTQVDDAALWVELLAKDKRFRSIGVIGHSEGASIGALVAGRGKVQALVSLAGAGKRFDEVMIEQMDAAVKAGQLPKKSLEPLRAALAELRAGRTVASRPPEIPDQLWTGLFQPRAQEYLISMFRYDPVAETAKLPAKGVRVLIVQGTADEMAGRGDPELLAAAVGTQPVMINGMMHELKLPGQKGLADGLMDHLVRFLTDALK